MEPRSIKYVKFKHLDILKFTCMVTFGSTYNTNKYYGKLCIVNEVHYFNICLIIATKLYILLGSINQNVWR